MHSLARPQILLCLLAAALLPGAAAARRFGADRVMAIAAGLGSLALIWTPVAGSAGELITTQLVTGAAWGTLFMGGITLALNLGTSGREGLVLGLWFTMLSAAAAVRVGLALSGGEFEPIWDDLRRKVERAQSELPDGVDRLDDLRGLGGVVLELRVDEVVELC